MVDAVEVDLALLRLEFRPVIDEVGSG